MNGLPRPIPNSIVRVGDIDVEVFRCDTDGGLVLRASGYDSQPIYQAHGGHRLIQPVILKPGELEMIEQEILGK